MGCPAESGHAGTWPEGQWYGSGAPTAKRGAQPPMRPGSALAGALLLDRHVLDHGCISLGGRAVAGHQRRRSGRAAGLRPLVRVITFGGSTGTEPAALPSSPAPSEGCSGTWIAAGSAVRTGVPAGRLALRLVRVTTLVGRSRGRDLLGLGLGDRLVGLGLADRGLERLGRLSAVGPSALGLGPGATCGSAWSPRPRRAAASDRSVGLLGLSGLGSSVAGGLGLLGHDLVRVGRRRRRARGAAPSPSLRSPWATARCA